VGSELLAGVQVVDFDVPCLPVERLVVEDDELRCFLALGDKLTISRYVVERGDCAIGDLNNKLVIAKFVDVGPNFLDRRSACRVGRCKWPDA
jgi:hypothetical protein